MFDNLSTSFSFDLGADHLFVADSYHDVFVVFPNGERALASQPGKLPRGVRAELTKALNRWRKTAEFGLEYYTNYNYVSLMNAHNFYFSKTAEKAYQGLECAAARMLARQGVFATYDAHGAPVFFVFDGSSFVDALGREVTGHMAAVPVIPGTKQGFFSNNGNKEIGSFSPNWTEWRVYFEDHKLIPAFHAQKKAMFGVLEKKDTCLLDKFLT